MIIWQNQSKKMNLKKYKKLREKIAQKPVDWLEGSVRIQNFCRNHHIEYIFQLIDTDIFQETRRSFKNYRLIEARLKEKTGIDFEFINGNENDTYRIIPKFISEAKQKAAKASLEQAEDRSAMTRSCGKPVF
ncbi:MAG: hypothetical protein Q4B64_10725 [Spirochaetales bacterium]|nr:hypothetical protein [Spirochaetales bacterium]